MNAGMTVNIASEEWVLRAIATGTFTSGTAEKTFLEVIDAVLESKKSNVLFDCLELKGEPETMDRFYYGKFTAEMCFKFLHSKGIVPKFAYVLKIPVLDSMRFGETVARNRGMMVTTFDNLDDAREWLREWMYLIPIFSK